MTSWVAVVRPPLGGERLLVVTGRNRFEALRAVAEMCPGGQVLKLRQGTVDFE